MIPTLNPFAPKKTKTRWGEEAEMQVVEASDILAAPMPNNWEDLANRSSALYLTGLTDEALAVASRAVELQRTVGTLVNMSVILETLSRFDEALIYAHDAATLDPEDGRARALYGEALIRMGRLTEGWPLYCEQRASFDWIRELGVAEWTGSEDLRDKRLLVIEGGGYGDNIYFLRWLDALRHGGAHIDYICQPSFAPLVQQLGYRAIENWAGNIDIRLGDYDYFTGLLSVAHKLQVTFENYVWTGPYIKAYAPKHSGLRVGICTRAGEGTSPRKQRSMHDSQLKHVLNALSRKHTWVNLTYGHELPSIVDRPVLDDWVDTARAAATCDLIVSVDTGISHLGGAMDIPTWVILPGASAWQWGLRDHHPFYPSVHMFRNGCEGMDNSVEIACDHLSHL